MHTSWHCSCWAVAFVVHSAVQYMAAVLPVATLCASGALQRQTDMAHTKVNVWWRISTCLRLHRLIQKKAESVMRNVSGGQASTSPHAKTHKSRYIIHRVHRHRVPIYTRTYLYLDFACTRKASTHPTTFTHQIVMLGATAPCSQPATALVGSCCIRHRIIVRRGAGSLSAQRSLAP